MTYLTEAARTADREFLEAMRKYKDDPGLLAQARPLQDYVTLAVKAFTWWVETDHGHDILTIEGPEPLPYRDRVILLWADTHGADAGRVDRAICMAARRILSAEATAQIKQAVQDHRNA